MFEEEGQPFLGVIIGPYYNQKAMESIFKVFHNKKGVPFSLTHRLMPVTQKVIRKELL